MEILYIVASESVEGIDVQRRPSPELGKAEALWEETVKCTPLNEPTMALVSSGFLVFLFLCIVDLQFQGDGE
ncbi:MAG: hypothetical protein APF81_16140 [Desulfosporosinus sp. BRH_c37]|nr:MAG: hypothetical protein APF81_16140 [Desulfosporosinus sp. BRH_c37]